MAKAKKRERTLSYRRVIWVKGAQANNLERHLRKAHEGFTTTAERTFPYNDGEIQGAKIEFEDNADGLLAHIGLYVHHQSASVLPFPGSEESSEATLHPPPDAHNYSGKEVFFLIKGNDIALCTSNAHENVATLYIKHILRKAGKKELTTFFSIEPIANISKLRLIREKGVKKIHLNASVYDATLRYEKRKTVGMTMLNEAAQALMIAIGKDIDEKEMENLSVKVEYSFDLRKEGGELAGEHLKKTAVRLVEEDDQGFKIETGDGSSFGAEDLYMRKKVRFEPFGDSIFRSKAWEALKEYLGELKQSGISEQ
uniref:Uncharacterized protein n=1 Tax=Candidatus Kentrum sp. FM TaxID=2126340 RepID=A0A450WJF8_9GAMM|nr:MAG: hypothetical protein BECKFM1743C_GA0114222_103403 [Candidatus Kentron sp. FM]VFJ64060.1 MAG: hypothetical protein BECKFM1743A_GA0114220_103473 [Candidatus Kentron sp. FM]VFK17159.1 MAG: hypothetical protein BECKFM1743B_GA0114221_104643 [Candidatus Kentron sp. FM]